MPLVRTKSVLRGCTTQAVLLLLPHLLAAEELPPKELARVESGDLTLILSESALRVEGSSPGGEVAYLGVNLVEHHEGWGSVDSYAGVLSDPGASGELELTPKGGISQASVWVVVDIATGEVAGASPASFKKRLPDEMTLEVSSSGDTVSVDRSDLEFLLYRPGAGVWFGKATDRHKGDDAGGDNGLQLGLSAFQPLRAGAAAAPTRLQPGDRLLAVDLHNLDAASLTFR